MSQSSSDRIVRILAAWIATAQPGSRLPTTRELMAEHSAGPATVQNALRALAAKGLTESRIGVGTFVRAAPSVRPTDYSWQTAALGSAPARTPDLPAALRTAPNDIIALHAAYPDRALLPEAMVKSALTRAARSDTALSRPPTSGLPELQSWLARELGAFAPAGVMPPTASDVIVLPGSQSGLSSIFRALIPTGQPLLMESPTYWGAILAAARVGVRVVPVPTGPDGPHPADLARAFADSGARAFYAQPTYANPTGAQWSPDRARQVLEVVREHGAFLIEDDWARDFGITTTPAPIAAHDDDGRVVYLRSFTKSVSPSLRVAAVIARGPARERILADRAVDSMYVSGVLQAAVLDVVNHPSWNTHLRHLRAALRSRRDLLVGSLEKHAPSVIIEHLPPGGLNLWARLPEGTDVGQLARACERAGLMIAPGDEWFPAEPAGPYIRLNYSGPNPSAFGEGAKILGATLAIG